MRCFKFIKKILYFTVLLGMIQIQSNAQGVTVPGGYGIWGGMVYGGTGLLYPNYYEGGPYIVSSFGGGIGNPVNNLGVQFNLNWIDVHENESYTFDIKAHRYLKKGFSVAIGFENMLSFGPDNLTDGATSPFLSVSQNLSKVSGSPFLKEFTYSIGVGMGRFSEINEFDIGERCIREPSYVFGAIQYRIAQFLSLHAEWDGVNINAGISAYGTKNKFSYGIMLSAVDITPASGDGEKYMASVGFLYDFGKKEDEKGDDDLEYYVEDGETSDSVKTEKKGKDYDDSMIRTQLNNTLKQNEHLLNKQQELIDDIVDLETRIKRLEAKNNINRGNYVPYDMSGEDVEQYSPRGDPLGVKVEPGFYIVVFTFRQKRHALQAVGRLNYIGINSSIGYNNNREYYYLMSQKYETLDEAIRRADEIRDLGYEDAWIHQY